jgi:hypothetical protein
MKGHNFKAQLWLLRDDVKYFTNQSSAYLAKQRLGCCG